MKKELTEQEAKEEFFLIIIVFKISHKKTTKRTIFLWRLRII